MRGGATFINEGLASFEGSIGDRADLNLYESVTLG